MSMDGGPLVTIFGHLKLPVPQRRATPVAARMSDREEQRGGLENKIRKGMKQTRTKQPLSGDLLLRK